MACNEEGQSSSAVGRKVTAFFRRLVKTNRDDGVHTCVPHDSVNRAIDLYRQIEKASDGGLKERRSTRKGKRINKRCRKAREERRKSGKESSTDESGTEDQAAGGTPNDLRKDDCSCQQGTSGRNCSCSLRTAYKDVSCKENPNSKRSKPAVSCSGGRDLSTCKEDGEYKSPSVSYQSNDTGHDTGKGKKKAKGQRKKCDSHPSTSSGGTARDYRTAGRSDPGSDLREETSKPARRDQVRTEEITVSFGVSHSRTIRAKTCTVRDPTFVWRESDDGLETKPVGMVKKKKGKKKQPHDDSGEIDRPGTPKPPPLWPSDSDPLEGLEELLEDVVKMEERYTERRRRRVVSTLEAARKNKNNSTIVRHPDSSKARFQMYMKSDLDGIPCKDSMICCRRVEKSANKDQFDPVVVSDEHSCCPTTHVCTM